MKKLFILFSFITLILTFNSCIVNEQPNYPPVKACFAVSGDIYAVNEIIYFNNCSENVVSYHWDFGDGTYSSEAYPSHAYSNDGSYNVRLTAYGRESQSEMSMVLTVNSTTDLDLLVMYYGGEDPISNCEVALYDNLTDWQNIENDVAYGTTDSNGLILFVDVNAIVYYIDAFKSADETLYWSNEMLDYATDELEYGVVNYYNVYVELLSSAKDKFDRKSYIIKKIEKTDGNDIYRKSRVNRNTVKLK